MESLVVKMVKEEKAELNHGDILNGGTYPSVSPILSENKNNHQTLTANNTVLLSLNSSLLLGAAQIHMGLQYYGD